MSQSYNHIYLSPHYDDAALSCGGAIWQQVQAGERVLVITICAAIPDPAQPLSPFAQSLHHAWGDFSEMVAVRRAEDEAAMRVLGVDYLYLDITDCIYRGNPDTKEWYYQGLNGIFGEIHPADLILASEIASTITGQVTINAKSLIYSPLTVGHHVDHQLTFTAARELQRRGKSVIFYEDYPYTDPHYPFQATKSRQPRAHRLEGTLTAKPNINWSSSLRFLDEAALTAKVASIEAYASQMEMLFEGPQAMAERVRAYTTAVGEGRPAERLWRD